MEKKKKKLFIDPKMEVICFNGDDLIATSGGLINEGVAPEIGTDGEHFGG